MLNVDVLIECQCTGSKIPEYLSEVIVAVQLQVVNPLLLITGQKRQNCNAVSSVIKFNC